MVRAVSLDAAPPGSRARLSPLVEDSGAGDAYLGVTSSVTPEARARPGPKVAPGAGAGFAGSEPPGAATPSEESPADDQKPSHLGRKIALGALLATTVLGATGVTAAHVAATAPICRDGSTIGWQDGRPCVSQEVATRGATAWRVLESLPHMGGAYQGYSSSSNELVRPQNGAQPVRAFMEDGQLKVVSWNLHHGLSRDGDGARPQLDEIRERLAEQRGDVYLLQEVAPGDVQSIVDELGMPAYYSATTPLQGNLVVLHPDLEVEAQHDVLLAGQRGGNELERFTQWVLYGHNDQEPRSLQVIEARLPDGSPAVFWNTHFPTAIYEREVLNQAVDTLVGELNQEAGGSRLVIGGGDLNQSDGQPLLQALGENGFTPKGHHIDWVTARNLEGSFEARGEKQWDEQGVQLSDHPMVTAEFDLD